MCKKPPLCYSLFSHKLKVHASLRLVITNRGTQGMNKQVLTASADTESKTSTSCSPTLSAADTQNTKFCQAFRWKKIYTHAWSLSNSSRINGGTRNQGAMGHPQPGKPSIPSRRPLSVQLLPWFYHGNSY